MGRQSQQRAIDQHQRRRRAHLTQQRLRVVPGFFIMPRGWQDHPAWCDEPFSRAQAWAWLVEEARWRPSRISIAGRTVELQRGELSYSIRFLAERWGWGKGVVERFISRLKTETLIETRAETGQLVITICNYDEMQSPEGESRTAGGTASETPSGQQQDSTGTKKNKGNKGNTGNEGSSSGGSRLPIDWELPAAWASEAESIRAKAGLPAIDLDLAADRFRDFWLAAPGKAGIKANWRATWRNWIRRERGTPLSPVTGRGKAAEQDAAAADMLAAIDRMAGE